MGIFVYLICGMYFLFSIFAKRIFLLFFLTFFSNLKFNCENDNLDGIRVCVDDGQWIICVTCGMLTVCSCTCSVNGLCTCGLCMCLRGSVTVHQKVSNFGRPNISKIDQISAQIFPCTLNQCE